jgi:hypothetical protein
MMAAAIEKSETSAATAACAGSFAIAARTGTSTARKVRGIVGATAACAVERNETE